MQREIKFKGKDVRTGETVTGSLVVVYVGGTKGYIIVTDPIIHGEHSSDSEALVFSNDEVSVVYPDYVKQYTGLKDIQGREIYEGDKVRYDGQRIGEIVWHAPAAAFMFKEQIADGFAGFESLAFKKNLELIQP